MSAPGLAVRVARRATRAGTHEPKRPEGGLACELCCEGLVEHRPDPSLNLERDPAAAGCYVFGPRAGVDLGGPNDGLSHV